MPPYERLSHLPSDCPGTGQFRHRDRCHTCHGGPNAPGTSAAVSAAQGWRTSDPTICAHPCPASRGPAQGAQDDPLCRLRPASGATPAAPVQRSSSRPAFPPARSTTLRHSPTPRSVPDTCTPTARSVTGRALASDPRDTTIVVGRARRLRRRPSSSRRCHLGACGQRVGPCRRAERQSPTPARVLRT